jgi:hypothetical protein
MQLEITMRFDMIKSGASYMSERALSGLKEFDIELGTQLWFRELDWHDCPVIERYHNLWEDFFISLVGAEEQKMSRWRALYLAFPNDDILADRIFRALDNVAPQLRDLAIEHWDEFEEGSFAHHSFGNLDSLERLTLNGDIMPRDFSRCTSIRILELVDTWNWSCLQDLDHLRGLSSLHIDYNWRPLHTTIIDIELPSLRKLHFSGHIPNIIQSIRCNSLSNLIIEGGIPGDIGRIPYPEADIFKAAKFVGILLLVRDVFRDWDRPIILSNIASLLDQLLAADTIGVKADMADDIFVSVMACREKGGLSALRSMVIIDEYGDLVREHTSFYPTAMHAE